MLRTLGVVATVLVVYAATFALLSLGIPNQDPPMPRAHGLYEPKAALSQLRPPCERPYMHSANGRTVHGCAK